ncbi:hypothetical protein M9H77_31318 [Catharanthus roseus]|uniref:Uncharacterized protein n=1 Tax=Catharanthus roseus TaxID=4058 RepID=A0ACC0A049_CATRO|nr:hypothetical protein M9H77_31318 [Catharanthus roseus]
MEEDHSWMCRRTVPGVIAISSEFQLERIFPLSFFDVMEHLMVSYCMRLRYKRIKNKARVEGLICNAYLVEEAATFYSYYFEPHVSTNARDSPRNDEDDQPRDGESGLSIFNGQERAYGNTMTRYLDDKEYKATTNYIMLNCDEDEPKYKAELRTCFPSLTESDVQTRISDEFSMWFREEMENPVNASNSECLKCLSWGPSKRMKSYIGTLMHELGELESVDIRRSSSIVDEDENNEEKRSIGSSMKKRKRKSLNQIISLSNLFVSFSLNLLRRSKKRAHPTVASTPVETSTMCAVASTPAASTPVETSTTLASIPLETFLYPTTASTPLGIPVPTSTPSASSSARMSSTLAPSSLARPPAPGVVNFRILILLTANREVLIYYYIIDFIGIVVYLFSVPRNC